MSEYEPIHLSKEEGFPTPPGVGWRNNIQFFQPFLTESILGLAEDYFLGRQRPHGGSWRRGGLYDVIRAGFDGEDGDILGQWSRVESLCGQAL